MILFWILAGILAAFMFLFGVMKVVKPREELKEFGMLWVEDFTDQQVKLLGIAETLGAIGIIVPAATGILPILSPIAAVCLGVLMLGAFGTHVRRKDPALSMVITAALTGFSVFVTWHGFMA